MSGVLISSGGSAASLNVSGLTPNTGYTYTVSAVNSFGEGPQSLPVSATTSIVVPAQVTGLTAVAAQNVITLNWTAVLGATSYSIFQNGTTIPAASSITDSSGNVWTVTGGVISKNGALAGFSAAVILLLYYNGIIYQENSSNQWFQWLGTAWSTQLAGDPRGGTAAIVTGLTNPSYIDSGLLFNKEYTFTVAALNSSGIGPQSVGASATTQVQAGGGGAGVFGVAVRSNGTFYNPATGNTWKLAGGAFSGFELAAYRWPGIAAITPAQWKASAVKWGYNCIRLYINTYSWLNLTGVDGGNGNAGNTYHSNGNGTYTADPNGVYRGYVETTVANLTAAGLISVIVMMWDAPNNSSGQPQMPMGQPPYPSLDHAPACWTSLATTFMNNPAVIYEIFNEPFGSNNFNNWVHGGNYLTYTPGPDALICANGASSYSPWTGQDNNQGGNITYAGSGGVAGELSLLNTIRATGATNVVLASPIGYAGQLSVWKQMYANTSNPDPLKQFGIAWHIYSDDAPSETTNIGLVGTLQSAGYPILITETYGLTTGLLAGFANGATYLGGAVPQGYAAALSNNVGVLPFGYQNYGGHDGPTLAAYILANGPWAGQGAGLNNAITPTGNTLGQGGTS